MSFHGQQKNFVKLKYCQVTFLNMVDGWKSFLKSFNSFFIISVNKSIFQLANLFSKVNYLTIKLLSIFTYIYSNFELIYVRIQWFFR